MNLPGLEPGIFCSVGRRVIHCATSPYIPKVKGLALIFITERTQVRINID